MNKMDVQSAARMEGERPATQNTRLAEVEVLRATAVIMVLLDHLSYNLLFWPSHLANFIFKSTGLWSGVDLFFAISGFVIARSLVPRLSGVTDWVAFSRIAVTFWIARAWRLLPSAWLWLTVPLFLCTLFNRSGAYGTFAANWGMFTAGMLDLANFHVAMNYGAKLGTAFVQWSLSLEEQFYLLLPFAVFFCRRWLFVPLILIAAAGFFVPNTAIAFQVRLWPVAFGVLLALWSRHQSYLECAPTGLGKSRIARIGAYGLLVLSMLSVGSLSLHVVTFYQGPIALLSVILVWIASYDRGYLWRDGLARRVMELIAARSYSLYLVHIPVYFAAHEIWFRLFFMQNPTRPQAAAVVALAVFVVFVIAELNHRLLEKPLREHGKRLAARYRARMAMEMA